jgi:hypothetical protein
MCVSLFIRYTYFLLCADLHGIGWLALDGPVERHQEELVFGEFPQVGHHVVVGHHLLQDGDDVELPRPAGHVTESVQRMQVKLYISGTRLLWEDRGGREERR